jgi:predicted ribosomally synthesized peptide with SipW-like signal peptide
MPSKKASTYPSEGEQTMKSKKLLTSLLVIGLVVAAVAGSTYAVFTSQVQSDIQEFSAGTLEIEVDGQSEEFETTFHMSNMEPGDNSEQEIDLHNTGSLDLSYVVYVDYEYPPSGQTNIFYCDGDNSLQAWAEPDVGTLSPSQHANVTLKALFPLAAGNSCQGETGKLRVTVHAVQASNLDGFECVKLVYKDEASNWLPYGPGNSPGGNWQGQHGNVCYKADDDDHLRLVVNAYGLNADEYYQLSLNGPGGCSNFEDTTFAGMTANQYHSGWWTGGTSYLATSCSEEWHQGVYNFTGTDGEVQADSNGNISLDFTIDGSDPLASGPLPSGSYEDVKFLIKEIGGYSGGAPSHTDHGSSWTPMLMEIRALNFTIP